MTQRGIDGARIRIMSFGEERLACLSRGEACGWKNRRAEFEIMDGDAQN